MLVDHIFSGLSNKDNAATLLGQGLATNPKVDALGQFSLGDPTWLL